MNKKAFFKIIEKTLEQVPFKDIINYDEILLKELAKKTDKEIAQFHISLNQIRRELDNFEVNKVASALDLNTSREVFNRFCNGIIASGEKFYTKIREEKGFLESKLQNDPNELKKLYYEGFGLVSSAAFYDKNGLDADWDSFLKNEKRLLEISFKKNQTNDLER